MRATTASADHRAARRRGADLAVLGLQANDTCGPPGSSKKERMHGDAVCSRRREPSNSYCSKGIMMSLRTRTAMSVLLFVLPSFAARAQQAPAPTGATLHGTVLD